MRIYRAGAYDTTNGRGNSLPKRVALASRYFLIEVAAATTLIAPVSTAICPPCYNCDPTPVMDCEGQTVLEIPSVPPLVTPMDEPAADMEEKVLSPRLGYISESCSLIWNPKSQWRQIVSGSQVREVPLNA